MPQGTIVRAERGANSQPTTLARIAAALGDELLTVAGELRLASITRSDDPSVTERTHRVADADARIVLDLPEDALRGLSPARVELVLTRARLAALEAAQEQQEAQARNGGSSA